MITRRLVAGLTVAAALVAGCASAGAPSTSVGPSASPTPGPSPTVLATAEPPTLDLTTERYGPEVGSGSAAADEEAVWITAHDVATIWRLPLD